MPRMYVAALPDADHAMGAAQRARHLAAGLPELERLNWHVPEHLHVTLCFFPDVAENTIDELWCSIVEHVHSVRSGSACFAGAGAFPDAAHATVLWLRPQSQVIQQLAAACRAAADAIGCRYDPKPFTAHLTVARSRQPVDATGWVAAGATTGELIQGPEQGSSNSEQSWDTAASAWQVADVHLIARHDGERSSRWPFYDIIRSVPLTAE